MPLCSLIAAGVEFFSDEKTPISSAFPRDFVGVTKLCPSVAALAVDRAVEDLADQFRP